MEERNFFVFVGPTGKKAERESAQMSAKAEVVSFDCLEAHANGRKSVEMVKFTPKTLKME